jgi:hypothetical protein
MAVAGGVMRLSIIPGIKLTGGHVQTDAQTSWAANMGIQNNELQGTEISSTANCRNAKQDTLPAQLVNGLPMFPSQSNKGAGRMALAHALVAN